MAERQGPLFPPPFTDFRPLHALQNTCTPKLKHATAKNELLIIFRIWLKTLLVTCNRPDVFKNHSSNRPASRWVGHERPSAPSLDGFHSAVLTRHRLARSHTGAHLPWDRNHDISALLAIMSRE